MKRRAFLGLIAAVPAALVLPELILPRKTFFLPPARGWFGDDTRYLQSLIDSGMTIPPGIYEISNTIVIDRPRYTMQGVSLLARIPPDHFALHLTDRAHHSYFADINVQLIEGGGGVMFGNVNHLASVDFPEDLFCTAAERGLHTADLNPTRQVIGAPSHIAPHPCVGEIPT